MARSLSSYFFDSILLSVLGIALAGALGYWEMGTSGAIFHFIYLTVVLSLLELSISFENAVVNATVLRHMTPTWQRRFLTWGIWIAVFGMRLICPLLIVSVAARVNPWAALTMSVADPDRYAQIMLSIHHEVNAFGGAFLAMAALKYFFNVNKTVHWIHAIEAPLAKMGRLESIEVIIVLATLYGISRSLDPAVALSVLMAGLGGIITYLIVNSLAEYLKAPLEKVKNGQPGGRESSHLAARASLGMFLYLEVLDASFSFDGVIGAFAISNHLLIITIGLGIGALFVRSLTVLMVDKGTLDTFTFLENGAFWAVGSLATIMFLGIHLEISEVVTSTVGMGIIIFSIYSSLKERKKPQA